MGDKLRIAAALLMCAVAVLLGFRACGSGHDQLAAKANSLDEAVANRLGRLVRETIDAPGTIILILVPGLDELGKEMNERTRSAFERGLGRRSGNVEVIDFEADRSPDEFFSLAGRIYNGQWADQLVAWMQAHSDAAAVVNLNQLPSRLEPDDLADLPPLLTVLPWIPEARGRALVSSLGLRAGLLPRDTMHGGAGEGSPDELFDAAYQILTP